MDDMNIEEFLEQCKLDTKFAETFRENGFYDVHSLRCINVKEDIAKLFPGNTLLLAEKRKMEKAISILIEDIEPNAVGKKSADATGTALNKIKTNTIAKINEKKRKLHDLELDISILSQPVELPAAQGTSGLRCSKCHITGHKKDGNKNGRSCWNSPCRDFTKCGRPTLHPEYTQRKKQLDKEMKELKGQIKSLEDEQTQLDSYKATNFASTIRNRLRATNSKHYQDSAKLMTDIMALKKAYNGKVPPQNQDDNLEFPKKISEIRHQTLSLKSRDKDHLEYMNHNMPHNSDSMPMLPYFYPQQYQPFHPYQYPPVFPQSFMPAAVNPAAFLQIGQGFRPRPSAVLGAPTQGSFYDVGNINKDDKYNHLQLPDMLENTSDAENPSQDDRSVGKLDLEENNNMLGVLASVASTCDTLESDVNPKSQD